MQTCSERRERKPKLTATVQFDATDYETLADFAKEIRKPVSWVVRESVKRYIEAEAAREGCRRRLRRAGDGHMATECHHNGNSRHLHPSSGN